MCQMVTFTDTWASLDSHQKLSLRPSTEHSVNKEAQLGDVTWTLPEEFHPKYKQCLDKGRQDSKAPVFSLRPCSLSANLVKTLQQSLSLPMNSGGKCTSQAPAAAGDTVRGAKSGRPCFQQQGG